MIGAGPHRSAQKASGLQALGVLGEHPAAELIDYH
jgi:hypothetical protein